MNADRGGKVKTVFLKFKSMYCEKGTVSFSEVRGGLYFERIFFCLLMIFYVPFYLTFLPFPLPFFHIFPQDGISRFLIQN
jgi:hypothetical protein